MSQYFIPFLMMQVNNKMKDYGLIGVFFVFLINFIFENNGIYEFIYEYLKTIFSKQNGIHQIHDCFELLKIGYYEPINP